MFRKVLSVAPQTVTYGLAGRRVLTNKISSYFQKADKGDIPDNGKKYDLYEPLTLRQLRSLLHKNYNRAYQTIAYVK